MGSSHNDKAKFVARYIEGFIDLVENVPNDLSRRVTRLHELQLGYEYSLRKLESNLTRFSRPKGSDIRQLKLLLATQNCLIEMQEISDSKLAILQDALEQLESKSRELDNDFKQIAATSEGTDTTKEQQPSASSSQPKSKTTRESPEPTYCTCHQVSYGDMICCDNDACPIEWFHFQCVSLTTKPKGRWYCPSCRGDRSNQPRKTGLL